MPVNDPIADMLTRVRNGLVTRHETVLVPASKMKVTLAELLKREGFIKNYEVLQGEPQNMIRLHLKYYEGKEPAIRGLRRISKPGLRIYVGKKEVPRIFGGLGISVLSTPQGVMTGRDAWRQGVGGELLCYVW